MNRLTGTEGRDAMAGRNESLKGNRLELREGHAALFDSHGNEILVGLEDLPRISKYTWYAVRINGRLFARANSRPRERSASGFKGVYRACGFGQ